ncbi:hypothetical protein HOY82DRAFT_350329 [Tuber indicum]|nr:hypothetical protein HOY82DRAFT_350329 [Tuber indicum]
MSCVRAKCRSIRVHVLSFHTYFPCFVFCIYILPVLHAFPFDGSCVSFFFYNRGRRESGHFMHSSDTSFLWG